MLIAGSMKSGETEENQSRPVQPSAAGRLVRLRLSMVVESQWQLPET